LENGAKGNLQAQELLDGKKHWGREKVDSRLLFRRPAIQRGETKGGWDRVEAHLIVLGGEGVQEKGIWAHTNGKQRN